jgi:hypothetical protein
MIVLGHSRFERPYKDYLIEGSAQPLGPNSDLWIAVATVLLRKSSGSVLQVGRYRDPLLAYENGDLAAWFGLGIAEIAVDHCIPPPSFHLTPMNVARAIDMVLRGAEDHHKREMRRPEMYDALTFLDRFLGKKNWLVRRYRNALRGDTRNQREKLEQREKLRVCFRGIQHACIETLLAEINDLARRYRENRPRIDALRRQLAVVQRPVGK